VQYLHSEVDTLERVRIIRDLRLGKFDVLVGREPSARGPGPAGVSLVAILDADKEGYLRSANSLIQIMGRAARMWRGGHPLRQHLHRLHAPGSLRVPAPPGNPVGL